MININWGKITTSVVVSRHITHVVSSWFTRVFDRGKCSRNTTLVPCACGVWECFSMPNSATRGYMRLHAPAVKGHILALSQGHAPRGEAVETHGGTTGAQMVYLSSHSPPATRIPTAVTVSSQTLQLDCKMVLDTVPIETTQRWDQLASRDANPLGRTLTALWFVLRSRSCCHFWPVGSEAQRQGDLLTK